MLKKCGHISIKLHEKDLLSVVFLANRIYGQKWKTAKETKKTVVKMWANYMYQHFIEKSVKFFPNMLQVF